jgi:hypothetical protein
MKRALIATLAAAIAGFTLAACTDQPEPDVVATAFATTATPLPPLTPPPPVPRTAEVGQAIQVAELVSEKVQQDDPEPWARATITVTSAELKRGDPSIRKDFWPPNNGKYLAVTIRTDVTEEPFIIWSNHFELIAPDGTKYPKDENYYYLPDHFEDRHESDNQPPTPGAAEPGSGVLLFDVPANGVPKGTRVEVTLFKGQPFGWTVA